MPILFLTEQNVAKKIMKIPTYLNFKVLKINLHCMRGDWEGPRGRRWAGGTQAPRGGG